MWTLPAKQSGSTQTETYRVDIEGLRAIAVLAVIGFACKIPGIPGGFVGFDVFFVISGYLICSTVLQEIQGNVFNISSFYARRCLRILPALSAVVLFCLFVSAIVLSPWEAYRVGDTAVATSLWAANLLYIIRTGYFAERALSIPLLMTWSLGLLVQFYLVFPLIMVVLRNCTKRSLIVCVAGLSALSFFLSLYAEFRLPIWNFYLPVTRGWEFGAGALLAIGQGGRLNSRSEHSWTTDLTGWIGILMIVGSVVLYRPQMRFPGYEAMLPVLGTVLILASPGGRANRLLAVRPLVAVGAIAYSLYLWHWPLLSFAEILSSKPLKPPTVCILIVVASAAAVCSYFLLEKPFVGRKGMKVSTVLISSGALTALLGSISLAFYWTNGLPWRNPALYAIESRAALYRHYPCISSGSYMRMSVQCVPEARASAPTMAVLGGGHAEAFAEGLRDFAAQNGWELVTVTRESCPPTKGVSQWSAVDSTLADSCRTFNRSALDYVLGRSDIRLVVLVGRWRAGLVPDGYRGDPSKQTDEQNFTNLRRGLGGEIAALESAGKRVIVLEDVPEFPYDPVAGVRSQYIPLRRVINRVLLSSEPADGDGSSEKRSAAVTVAAERANAQLVLLKAADPKLTLIDPKEVLCRDDRCYFSSKTDLYYVDAIHLSRSGAQKILPLLPNLKGVR